jgi:pyridoxal phosphate enzyme (YggS family)
LADFKIPQVPTGVCLIAVSKTRTAAEIEALYRQGQRDFGENYVQELLDKAQELSMRGCAEIRWHFIGHLQSNKVKVLLPNVHAIHSVDSVKLAKDISRHAVERGENPILCYLAVNIDREASKSGFDPNAVKEAAAEIAKLPSIDLRGLMCIPAPRMPIAEMKIPFAALRELEKSCQPSTHGELSMGMSDDYEIAIAEGATSVRVGTLIFGPRPAQKIT